MYYYHNIFCKIKSRWWSCIDYIMANLFYSCEKEDMIRRMLDILVCPFDKKSELELYVVKKELDTDTDTDKAESILTYNPSKFNTSNSGGYVNSALNENNKTETYRDKNDQMFTYNLKSDEEIVEGVLFCATCKRFYPIVEEIPIILPDELRDKEKDLTLLKKWNNSIPEKITKHGLPWHL